MATRTDALLSQAETGKMTCVQHPHHGRLSTGADLYFNAAMLCAFPIAAQSSRAPFVSGVMMIATIAASA